MDYSTLANDALVLATPYLEDLGKEAVDVGVKSGGKAVIGWIKARLTSDPGKAAVAEIAKAPEKASNRLRLQAALVEALEADPDAAASLKALLAGTMQTVNITGNNNIGFNASGSTVSINRG
jgi:hypothetical protein